MSIAVNAFTQTPLEEEYQVLVKPLVEAVRNNDKEKIIKLLWYPLGRQYPIPDIANEQAMRERYDQVFDPIVIDLIKKSSIENDWHHMGWRGIMLHNGLIWIDDYYGKVFAINYQSPQETAIRNTIILAMKNNIHASLRAFEKPSVFCETKNYKIRIDLLNVDNYRLALWPKEKEQHEIPGTILINGEKIFDGSGGNHYYIFDGNNYQYILSVNALGNFDGDRGDFLIYRGTKRHVLKGRDDKSSIVVKEEIHTIEN
ncbi:MAG: hypothetical protein LBD37_09300 [Treponema sp.]|nr:hypothetical protein [Treponema sp.]